MSGPETVVLTTRMMPALDHASATVLHLPQPCASGPAAPAGVSTRDCVEVSAPRAPRPCSERAAVSIVSDALAEGGSSLLRDVLRARPDVLARVGCMTRESLERQVDALDRGGSASEASAVARDVIDACARNLVHREAADRVGQRQTALTTLARDLPALLPRLARAAPGTPEASLAQMLQVRGDAGDRARAEAVIADGLDGIDRFSRSMGGASWDVGQFPDARERALGRLGMRAARPWDLAYDATSHERPLESAAHNVLTAIEVATAAVESSPVLAAVFGTPAAHVTAATLAAEAGAAGVALAGLGLGLYIHHEANLSSDRLAALGVAMGM
jgi:hypothetical protein